MDKFQVYDRNNNTWEDDKIKLMSGWSENFVLDKTTDTASIKVKYLDSQKPNWKSGDWCRILHLKDGETGATYTKYSQTITERKSVYDDLKITYDEANRKFILKYSKDFTTGSSSTGIGLWVSALFKPYNSDVNEEYSFLVFLDKNETFTKEYEIPSNYEKFIEGSLSIYNRVLWQGALYCKPYDETIEYYIPKNHEQYIIEDITMVYDKINDEWDCQLKLGEPIDITNGICCETRSFTNQIEKKIDNIGYAHEILNHYNVLKKILETTPLSTKDENTWANRIKIANIDWLKAQPFNDDTFSEPTLYDILMNKFDSTLGRTPVLYFDIDGETDKPFNTKKASYVLDFLRQDGFDKETISYSSLIQNAGQIISNESWQNKGDSVVSNFDNLAPLNDVKYFSDFLWAVPEVDTNERIISNYNNDTNKVWILKTPYPIKEIISITKMEYGGDVQSQWFERKTTSFENVLEEKQYKASNLYDTTNVIWYTEGENIIHLNDFYYKTSSLSVYRITYKPIVSGRYDESKDYQVIVNQNDGQVAEYRFSKYLEQYKNSLNKTDLIIQKTIKNWDDICEIGSRVVDGDKIYMITNVSIQNRGFDYDVVYQLNENHLRKSDSIVAPQEIRKNIEIGYNGLTDRKSCKIIKFEISQKKNVNNKIDIVDYYINKNLIFSSLLDININSPQLAKIRFRSILKRSENDTYKDNVIDRLCSFSKAVINNTFCFNLKYFDNAECGKQKILSNIQYTQELEVPTSPEQQIPILYTDGFGEVKYIDISLIHSNSDRLEDVEFIQQSDPLLFEKAVNETRKVINQTTNYPLTEGIEPNEIEYLATYMNIIYDKDMLDIFNFILGFKIESDTNMVLCKAFFSKSSIFIDGNYYPAFITIYNTNMKEEDILSFPAEYRNIISSQIIDNQIVMTFDGGKITGQSIVIWNNEKEPVLIINDIDKIDENFLTDTNIKINC